MLKLKKLRCLTFFLKPFDIQHLIFIIQYSLIFVPVLYFKTSFSGELAII